MRAVIQRARRGRVSVENRTTGEIGSGLVILVGVGPGDSEQTAQAMARKISNLRIFMDEQRKMNLSVLDVKGSALVISQFTLYADTRKGNRPSYFEAAPPEIASPLVDCFIAYLQEQGVPCQQGEFGAHMLVEIENDGPVTIWLEM
jgi:D-aminoacyl-tRNA deacylase